MGTGTTANACLDYGVDYIGSELSPAQVEFANKRLSKKIISKKSGLF
jgi:DNA modification methylase